MELGLVYCGGVGAVLILGAVSLCTDLITCHIYAKMLVSSSCWLR
jgi:hypothetical protein